MRGYAAALLAVLLLAACTLAPRDTGQGYLFSLSAIRPAPQELVGRHLIVAIPEASPELGSARVALLRPGRVWDYYAGLRWADFLPALVQDDMVRTLAGAGLFQAVAGDTGRLSGERLLVTDIRAFQAEYAQLGAPPLVRLRLSVTLESRPDRRVLAAFTLEAARRAAADRAGEIHAAFQSAFDDVLRQLVEQLGAHP